jgi:hypothetical protein
MPLWKDLRFRDLKKLNIVNNRQTLRHRIKYYGFPPGRMSGPNTRTWTEEGSRRVSAIAPRRGPTAAA